MILIRLRILVYLSLIVLLGQEVKCAPSNKSYRKNIIYTSSVAEWKPYTLDSIVQQCEEGDEIIFDADYEYSIDRCIKPKVSITINGCGKKLKTINKYNYVISLFDVQDVDYFKIKNLVIDGSYSTSNPDKTVPKEFFITVKNVNDVLFTHCVFQNIRTDYPNWKVGDEAYTIWVENYMRFKFSDNEVKNVYCPEFIKAVQRIDNRDKNKIATITNNRMEFVSTSSAIEVRFGRFIINNNEIGITHGSTINAFGFDSEINGNIFYGSHNSSSIDLSEQFAFNYVSSGIVVKNNYSEYSHDGFLMGDNVSDITIERNVYRADKIDKKKLDSYDRCWSFVERSCDRALILDHELTNIRIVSNTFIGSNALVSLNTLGRKKNITIKNNIIKNTAEPKRSSLVLTQIDGLLIKNNQFINTGSTFSYLDVPQFIVIGPTNSSDANERYIRDLVITKNYFSFESSEIKRAYIVAHTIYDKTNCNTLSNLQDIRVCKNKTSINGDILLISDVFDMNKHNNVIVKNNQFHDGAIYGNIKGMMPEISERTEVLKDNTIVERNGKRYFVVFGGSVSTQEVLYMDKGYIRDGAAILRRIQ